MPLNQALTTLPKSSTRYLNRSRVFVNPMQVVAGKAHLDTVGLCGQASSIAHMFLRAYYKASIANAAFHT
jgi:hypothetical protein